MTTTLEDASAPTIYLPRNSYRSVAFGTWKYGEASRLFSKKNDCKKGAPAECKFNESLQFTKSLDSKSVSRLAGLASTSTASPHQVPLAKLNRKSLCFSLDNLNGGGVEVVQPGLPLPSSPLHASHQSGGSLGSVVLHSTLNTTMSTRHKFPQSSQTADCYSSTEYVKYCSQNVYENVILDSRLCPRQSPALNRSMETLNERLVECLSTASTTMKRPENINGVTTSQPATATSLVVQTPYFVVDPCCSFATLGRSSGAQCHSPEMRNRTKSLDNATKLSVAPGIRAGDQRLEFSKAEEQSMTTSSSVAISTLMSAKRFLRRLYNSSTQKFRNNTAATSSPTAEKVEPKISNNEKFQLATSPFFEIRLPEPEERPYLPYNIHYQVDEDDDEQLQQSPATKRLLQPLIAGVASPYNTKLFTSNANYTNSPDEGVYCSSSASSSANSSTLNTRAHHEEKVGSNGTAPMAPVVPPNFEDFVDLSTAAAISPLESHRSLNIPLSTITPPQSSLGYASGHHHHPEAYDDCRNANTSFASACNGNNMHHSTMTTVSEPIRPFHSKEQAKKFPNWNELFRYLKQEITEIRASDANILSNLRAIENQLSYVRDSRENSQTRLS